MKWFYAFAMVGMSACSDGTVYFGEPDPDDIDGLADKSAATSMALTNLSADIDANSHEFFLTQVDGYSTDVLAMPRSRDRSITMLSTPPGNNFNLYGDHIVMPQCVLKYNFSIDFPEAGLELSEGKLDILMDSVERAGDCTQGFNTPSGALSESTITEDLVANTLELQFRGLRWSFKKVKTINKGWQSLGSENAPPKLQWPKAHATATGFILWGKELKDGHTAYATHYSDVNGSWTPLFAIEGAPNDLTWAAHAYRDGVLTVVNAQGIHTFDTVTMTWASTSASQIADTGPVLDADMQLGEESILLRFRGDDPESHRFMHYRNTTGWTDVTDGLPENLRSTRWQPILWDSMAFYLPAYDGKFALFFPDTQIWRDGPAPDMRIENYTGIRVINQQIVFTGKTHSYKLDRNALSWSYSDTYFGTSPGSVRAESPNRQWALEFGSISEDLEFGSGGSFSDNDRRIIELPEAVNIDATAVPAVAWVNNRLFVWGGCSALVDATCTSFSRKGYVTDTFIDP